MIVTIGTFTCGKIVAPTTALTVSVLGRIVHWLKENDPACQKIPHSMIGEKVQGFVFAVGLSLRVLIELIAKTVAVGLFSLFAHSNGRKTRKVNALGAVKMGDQTAPFAIDVVPRKRKDEPLLQGNVNRQGFVFGAASGHIDRIGSSVTHAPLRSTRKHGWSANGELPKVCARTVGIARRAKGCCYAPSAPYAEEKSKRKSSERFLRSTEISVSVAV